jgi:molybdopterin molybdotransferase
MPAGADAVVIQEDTARVGDRVQIRKASPRSKHVRAQGSDVSRGSVLLRPGDRLWPGEIGLLASQNIDRVQVYRRPEVALLSTGDELRALGENLGPGAIVNSNVYALTEMIRALGAVPVPFPAVPDSLPAIEAALRKALESDVVITMGGVSVGAYDFVHEAFVNVGIEPGFWKVRIKPGKPLAFAQFHGKPVIGVPGNPISAMVTFEILVAPCLRKMLGDPRPHPQPVLARATATREGQEIVVALHDRQGSGSLPSFVGVNALVILPSDRAELAAGEQVEAVLWGPGLSSQSSPFDGLA